MRYLYNDLHELAVRIDGNSVFAKLKGKPEKVADPHSIAITDASIENNLISKAEYEAF